MNTIKECEAIIHEYLAWLKTGLSVAEIGDGVCEITTPFLDRNNDHLQIYLFEQNGNYVLTDDGYTLSNLEMSGVDLSSPKRQRILKTILQGFGVNMVEGALRVEVNRSNLSRRKHNLIQAMLSVDDMFVMARAQVLSLFREDVEQFLRANAIRFTAMIKLAGRTGFDHTFDFVIPSSPKAPERTTTCYQSPHPRYCDLLHLRLERYPRGSRRGHRSLRYPQRRGAKAIRRSSARVPRLPDPACPVEPTRATRRRLATLILHPSIRTTPHIIRRIVASVCPLSWRTLSYLHEGFLTIHFAVADHHPHASRCAPSSRLFRPYEPTGKAIANVVPSPRVLSTEIAPPCNSTSDLAMANPSPDSPSCACRDSSPR